MQKKPWQFNTLAMIFFVIAISLPLQVMFLYGHDFSEINLVFNKLTILNKIIIGLCFVNSYLTFKTSRLVFFTVPLVIVSVFINNYYVSLYSEDFLPGITYIASLSFLLLPTLLLASKPWLVLMHPDRQWWRHEERFKLSLPISFLEGPVKMLNSFDVSASGMFLSCAKELFENGQLVQVTVPLTQEDSLSLHAKVVRKANSQGIYPEGVGLEFTNLGFKERFLLRTHLKKKLNS